MTRSGHQDAHVRGSGFGPVRDLGAVTPPARVLLMMVVWLAAHGLWWLIYAASVPTVNQTDVQAADASVGGFEILALALTGLVFLSVVLVRVWTKPAPGSARSGRD